MRFWTYGTLVKKLSLALAGVLVSTSALAQSPAFEAGSPRAVAESLTTAMSNGDIAVIRSVLYATTDSERKMVDAMAAMSAAVARLRPIVIKRYGEVPARTVTGDPAAAAADQHARLEGAYQRIDGETARLTFADPAVDAIVLRKIEGRWRVPVADKAADLSPAEVEMRAADLMLAAGVVEEVAALCDGGKWQTANDVAIAIQERILKAQQARIPPDAATRPASRPSTVPAETRPSATKASS
jgi:hypothetical protein